MYLYKRHYSTVASDSESESFLKGDDAMHMWNPVKLIIINSHNNSLNVAMLKSWKAMRIHNNHSLLVYIISK
jgi:hypothetical protein